MTSLRQQLDEAITAFGSACYFSGQGSPSGVEARARVDALVAEMAAKYHTLKVAGDRLASQAHHAGCNWWHAQGLEKPGKKFRQCDCVMDGEIALYYAARADSAGPSASPTGRAGAESGEGEQP